MTLIEIGGENLSEETKNSFRVRKAARAILLDNENKLALLHVKKRGYHKLPGWE